MTKKHRLTITEVKNIVCLMFMSKKLFIDCPFQKHRTTVAVVKNMAGGAGTDRQYSTVSQQLSLLAP